MTMMEIVDQDEIEANVSVQGVEVEIDEEAGIDGDAKTLLFMSEVSTFNSNFLSQAQSRNHYKNTKQILCINKP